MTHTELPEEHTTTCRVALVGAPNSGKTCLFNHLTGLNAKVANYPGVTVAKKTGTVLTGGRAAELEDLPGVYSLHPISPDEVVAVDVLRDTRNPVDAVVVVMNSTTLCRSVHLLADVLALGKPVLAVLTMNDELTARQGSVDVAKLSQALGVKVHPVVAHRGVGVDAIGADLADPTSWPQPTIMAPTQETQRHHWVQSVLTASHYTEPLPHATTRALDKVLLHPVAGLAVFFAVMFAFFQVIFTVAAPLADGLEQVLGVAGDSVASRISVPLGAAFVTDALVAGVGGVLVFVPQIALLFLMLSVMEASGYLARTSYLVDRLMVLTGLDGRAFVAMLSSVACAIPGIMATRTMPHERDRLATMMSAPLMTCSARLPVFVLLIGFLVPDDLRLMGFSAQGVAMFGLYLAGGASTMVVAAVLKATVFKSGLMPFFLELPPYRRPSVRTVLTQTWSAVSEFIKRAGSIICVATVVLWVLMTFPQHEAETAAMSESQASAYVLEHSYAARVGKAIEPVFEPLGFDWRVNIGLIGATAAREVFVSTLGAAAAAQDPEDPGQALADMRYTSGPHEGQVVFSGPTVVALLVWFIYAMQCVSTLAVMRRETGGWKWPAVAAVYMTVLAYGLAWVAHAVTAAVLR